MARFTHKISMLALTAMLATGVAWTGSTANAADDGSQWQESQTSTPAAASAQAPSKWLVLNSGGSGAGFGKGDLRKDLLSVAFWKDAQHGIASGKTGVFYTSDGGLKWTRVRENPSKEYPDIKVVIYYDVGISGPDELWVTEGKHPRAGRSLWHSTDAGKTWTDVSSNLGGPFQSSWGLLVRGQHIWTLGGWNPRSSYRSDDGGKTWSLLKLPRGIEPYIATTPVPQPVDTLETVFLLGARRESNNRFIRAYRSVDAGETWKEMNLPNPDSLPWLFSQSTMAFATPQAGVIGMTAQGYKFSGGNATADEGATASVLITRDGGATWQRKNLPAGEMYITSLWMDPDDTQHLFAGVWNGFIPQRGGPRDGTSLYETFDGGDTWVSSQRGATQINSLFGLNAKQLWGVGTVTSFASNDVVLIYEGH